MFGRKKAETLSPPEDRDSRVLHGIELADRLLEMEDANRKRKQTTGVVLGILGVLHVGSAILAADPLFAVGLLLDFGLITAAYTWYHRRLRKKIEVKQEEFEAVTSSNTPLLP